MTPKAMGKDKMSMLKVTLDQPHSLNLENKIKRIGKSPGQKLPAIGGRFHKRNSNFLPNSKIYIERENKHCVHSPCLLLDLLTTINLY